MRIYTVIPAIFLATAAHATSPTPIITTYEHGQFFATPTLKNGPTLKLLFDTGGPGANWGITGATAKAHGLKTVPCGQSQTCLASPIFEQGKGIPALNPRGWKDVDVWPDGVGIGEPGVLSAWYISSRTWTLDYPAHRLLLENADWHPAADARDVPLGLLMNDAGGIGTPYPRITITVAGEPLDLLLDTGATAQPTAAGMAAEGVTLTAGNHMAASYITTAVMNRWHKAHPDWPVVDKGDDIFGPGHETRIIQVPAVGIAGWTTGPVWFTERKDAAFGENGMSGFMDGEVHGAAGGNIYAPFRMTLDYAHKKAWFTCVDGCKPARAPEASSTTPSRSSRSSSDAPTVTGVRNISS
jgi:hypothetical protein